VFGSAGGSLRSRPSGGRWEAADVIGSEVHLPNSGPFRLAGLLVKCALAYAERVPEEITRQRPRGGRVIGLLATRTSRAVCDRLLAVGSATFRSFTCRLDGRQALHFQGPGVAVGP